MIKTPLNQFDSAEIEQLIGNVSFFKRLKESDPIQFSKLLFHTQVIDLSPNEVIIEKGAVDNNFYSLVSGKLNVFADQVNDSPIGWIAAGQVIGALALVNKQPRTATLASSALGDSRLLETDFSIFGELTDFSKVTLETKLHFYRDIVETTRQKLELYKIQSKDTQLTEELGTFTAFDGEEGSLEELEFMSEYISGLSWLLSSWNENV